MAKLFDLCYGCPTKNLNKYILRRIIRCAFLLSLIHIFWKYCDYPFKYFFSILWLLFVSSDFKYESWVVIRKPLIRDFNKPSVEKGLSNFASLTMKIKWQLATRTHTRRGTHTFLLFLHRLLHSIVTYYCGLRTIITKPGYRKHVIIHSFNKGHSYIKQQSNISKLYSLLNL